MTPEQRDTLKSICVDLIHACEVGAGEGILDEDEAAQGRQLAMSGIAILNERNRKLHCTGNGKLEAALAATAKSVITAELEAVNGNRAEAARRLGISRRALYYKMEELGINVPASHGNGYAAERRAAKALETEQSTCWPSDNV